MDPLSRHQQLLDAVGERIEGLQRRGDRGSAARLRGVHERVRADFARLRQAFSDDWRRMSKDAEAGLRELKDEVAAVDAITLGWPEDELAPLDRSLDDVTVGLERLPTEERALDRAGIRELRAQIEEAKKRRQAIGVAPPTQERAAVDSYSAAVKDVLESWRRRAQH